MSARPMSPETEITPEMIRAGTRALAEHDPEFENSEAGVIRIFKAMSEALHAGCGIGEKQDSERR